MGNRWTVSQEAAMNLDGKSLLVSAAAGSGKTSVLTERIIRRLTDEKNPADISRMLIVTFTRAAAAELKAKIAKALTNALAENPGNKRLANQLLLLGSADISTIDSFFQKIVRENFEQLEIPANFRIADSSELLPICYEVMESTAELFYEKYRSCTDTTGYFNTIRNNPFADMMDHLMSNRSDGKTIPLLLKYYEKFTSYPEGIELLHDCAKKLYENADSDFFDSEYGISIVDRLKETFTSFLNEAQTIKDSLAYDPDVAEKCYSLISSDIDFCRSACDSLKKNKYNSTQAIFNAFISKARFPVIKNKSKEVEYYKNWRTVFKEEIKKAQSLFSVPAAIVSEQMHKTADFTMMLYRLYQAYQAELRSQKLSKGILEHNDIRALLYRLLTDGTGEVSEFAKSLSSRYDAVYIDEYQDVDYLQDRIFEIIGGDRRFMVGDIKQSIYGFRGSEPSIFASYRREMPLYTEPEAESAKGNCVFMSDNFRCNRSVIEFANSVCSFLFSACEKSVGYRPQDDLVCSKPSQNTENAALVEVAVFDRHVTNEDESDSNVSDEAIWTAFEISKLLREKKLDNGDAVKPCDIAILVRNKAHGKSFAKALQMLNISVSSNTGSNLLHEPLFIDVLNFLRTIDNPYRDIPLSEFLLSPLGGFSLKELSDIRASAPDQKALFDAMQIALESDNNLAIRNKLEKLLSKIDFYRNNAQILPADRFLRLLYLDELLVSYSTEPALLYLYDQARIYQRTSWCGLYGFLNHSDKLIENGQSNGAGFEKAENAVTIMTVHHSKGLEFPVVFLCSCGSTFNRADMYETLTFHKSVGCATKLYNADVGGSETTILREAISAQIEEDIAEESIRTLYVALTRARERLYITGTLNGQWDKALLSAKLIKRGDRRAILGCSNYLSWILAALSEPGNCPSSCMLTHITHDKIPTEIEPRNTEKKSSLGDGSEVGSNLVIDPAIRRYAEIYNNQNDFAYELSALEGLPTKVAASKISPDLLDHLDDDNATEQLIDLMKKAEPSFSSLLVAKKNVTASDIGTATHSFLQFCNYGNLLNNGIDSEYERLVKNNFLDAETIKIINRDQLELFIKSDLMKEIMHAEKIYREQKFGISIPLATLTKNSAYAASLGSHSIFVQGSIDLLLQMPNGKLLLYDYKTDRIDKMIQKDDNLLAKELKKAHGHQLSCYVNAIQRLFGKLPDKTCIYSLPLGRAIEIEVE